MSKLTDEQKSQMTKEFEAEVYDNNIPSDKIEYLTDLIMWLYNKVKDE